MQKAFNGGRTGFSTNGAGSGHPQVKEKKKNIDLNVIPLTKTYSKQATNFIFKEKIKQEPSLGAS